MASPNNPSASSQNNRLILYQPNNQLTMAETLKIITPAPSGIHRGDSGITRFSLFLNLPPELRIHIYEAYFHAGTITVENSNRGSTINTSLLTASRQIWQESHHILYRINRFDINIFESHPLRFFPETSRSLSFRSFAQIRHLTLTLRFGSAITSRADDRLDLYRHGERRDAVDVRIEYIEQIRDAILRSPRLETLVLDLYANWGWRLINLSSEGLTYENSENEEGEEFDYEDDGSEDDESEGSDDEYHEGVEFPPDLWLRVLTPLRVNLRLRKFTVFLTDIDGVLDIDTAEEIQEYLSPFVKGPRIEDLDKQIETQAIKRRYMLEEGEKMGDVEEVPKHKRRTN